MVKPTNSLYSNVVLITSLLFLISCRNNFPVSEFSDFKKVPNYRDLIPNFRKHWAEKLSIDQTAVIQIGFRKIAGLGLCSYDSGSGDISLALMTTTGVKLLEVFRKSGNCQTRFSMPEFTDKQNARKQLILDVSTIYLQPKENYKYCEFRKDRMVYGWIDKSKKRIELIFGIPKSSDKIRLMEKKVYFDNTPVSIVYYKDYKKIKDKYIPMRIGYLNKKFGYSLILKNQKVYYD